MWSHELQHTRLLCPSLPCWACSNKSIESVMQSSNLILCHPILLLPSVFPNIRFFSIESALHIRWPKNWSFSFSIIPSNEYSGLISFRIYWFDLLARTKEWKTVLVARSLLIEVICFFSFLLDSLISFHSGVKEELFHLRQTPWNLPKILTVGKAFKILTFVAFPAISTDQWGNMIGFQILTSSAFWAVKFSSSALGRKER